FDLIGSFCAARRSASLASGSGTPASSNMTRPGLTTATQPSGEPLPLPMRVSAGCFVSGLSGKLLLQTFAPRLIVPAVASRAAATWAGLTAALAGAAAADRAEALAILAPVAARLARGAETFGDAAAAACGVLVAEARFLPLGHAGVPGRHDLALVDPDLHA